MKKGIYLLFFVCVCAGNAPAQFLFQDVTDSSHLTGLYSGVYDAGPGVIVLDFNHDGWDDLYLTGGIDIDRLLLNQKNGTFKEFTLSDSMKYHDRIYPRGGIAFDYDNDGHTDIYLVCERMDILWHNNGDDSTFTDMTRRAHLDYPTDGENQSMSASFGDFNGDGWNDFYVARWIKDLNNGPGTNGIYYASKGWPNWFYVNNHDGSFTDRAKEFGIDCDTSTSNIALFFDYDRDGDLDLLVGNDFGVQLTPNFVFKNMLMETGKATFVDVSHEIGMDTRLFCMGIGPMDYNRDGHFDFYETSVGPDSIMKNKGDNTFTNVIREVIPPGDGYEGRISGSQYMTTTWTALSGDFDNDGWEDEFVAHGFEGLQGTPWATDPSHLDTSRFYHNLGGVYSDYTDSAMNGKYLDLRLRGAAQLDYNHDGKLDICVGSTPDHNFRYLNYRLLENITPEREGGSHWLEMRFTAKRTAKEAIGTTVDVWAGGIVHSRQVSTGGGFGCQNSLMQHIGLGPYAICDSIVIFWPCDQYRHRQIDRYYQVPADKIYTVMENMNSVSDPTLINPPIPVSEVTHHPQVSLPKLYPNPALATLNVNNLSREGIKRMEIYDLLGIKRLDVTGSDENFSLSVGSLKPGCYSLRITSGGNIITKQFIKD